MYMMGYNRIVINAVSLFKDVGVFAVIDLYDTFKNIDKFFTHYVDFVGVLDGNRLNDPK